MDLIIHDNRDLKKEMKEFEEMKREVMQSYSRSKKRMKIIKMKITKNRVKKKKQKNYFFRYILRNENFKIFIFSLEFGFLVLINDFR